MSTRSLRVAYLGPPASFSHQAAREAFSGEDVAILHPLPSFKSIFSAIQDSSNEKKESFDFAVLPIENSTNGGVVQVFDLLVQCGLDPSSCLFPDVEVVAEHYLEVHHCLYVHPAAVRRADSQQSIGKSGVSLSQLNITTLYTHPQVWGQCNNFLTKHFPPSQTERADMPSTSAAAVFVAQNPPTVSSAEPPYPPAPGAICSSLAGVQNKLVLVESNIEDEPGKNTTRFLIIHNRRLQPPLPLNLLSPAGSNGDGSYHRKSLLTFMIPHTVPGSLASALEVFSKYQLNLTAIQTRPSRERNWHYVFFVECAEQTDTNRPQRTAKSQELLPSLRKVTERTCLLGSWIDRLRHE